MKTVILIKPVSEDVRLLNEQVMDLNKELEIKGNG